jgi:hypothetical protein
MLVLLLLFNLGIVTLFLMLLLEVFLTAFTLLAALSTYIRSIIGWNASTGG